jgi:ABC-type Fe3+/spermidine/putrescine transport system ATPase subunit
VAVARALVNRPRGLLLDEPLAALDRKLRRHMQEELRALQQQLGMTFVYVTHDQDEALALSDLIVLMDEGRIVQRAAPRDLYDRPGCVFAATFLGESNVISGTVRDIAGGVGHLETGDGVLPGEACDGLVLGAEGHLCVRPERVRVAPAGSSGLAGEVEDVVFRGATVRCILRQRSGARMVADQAVLPGVALPQRGQRVAAEWDVDAARVLAG